MIISRRHGRINALWRSFFMGWGLIFVMILATAPLLYRTLLWTDLGWEDLSNIKFDQFRITDGDFAGLDNDGNPFRVRAAKIWQTFENPDKILLETIDADIVQVQDGKNVNTDVVADRGEFSKATGLLVLTENVRIDSAAGDRVQTNKMTIQLRTKNGGQSRKN